MGTEAIITLVFGLIDRASQAISLMKKAKAEGRVVSEAELDQLANLDDITQKVLQAKIDAAKAEGR